MSYSQECRHSMIVVASIKYPLQRKHVRCSLRSTMGTRRATRWLAPSPAAEAAVLVTLLGAHSCCWSATTLAALLSIIRGHARAHAVILRIAPLGGGDRTSGDSRVTYKTNKNHTRTLCALRVCVLVCVVCASESAMRRRSDAHRSLEFVIALVASQCQAAQTTRHRSR